MIEYLLILLVTIPLTKVIIPNNEKNQKMISIFISIWLVVIIVISGLRGDFTADSFSYQKIFRIFSEGGWNTFLSSFNFNYHLNVTELGYVTINYIVGLFTKNFIWLQIIVACITYIPIAKWCRDSSDIGLSLCLFLSIGTYIEGLNTVRNIMAASIFIIGIKYIISGEFKKYLAICLLASTIHMSALIMIPIYFVFRLKPTINRVVLYLAGTMIFIFAIEKLAILYNRFFLVALNNEGVLALLHRRQANPVNIIVPVALVIIALFVYYRTSTEEEKNDMRNIVIVTGTIIWGMLKITMLVSEYTTRFACYFSPFVLLLLPMALNRFKGMQKIVVSTLVYIFCGIFFMTICKSYGEYYFFK